MADRDGTAAPAVCTIVHMSDRPHDPLPGDTRTMHERMLAGDPYVADDPQMAVDAARAVRLSAAYADAYTADPAAARPLLEALLGDLGEGAHLRPPLTVDYGTHITIGPRTFVNAGLVALDVARVTIGADCQIGPGVQLLTPTHPVDPDARRAGWEAAAPVTVGDNVWLGGGAVVLPGVTIGDDSVVGAGAVVTKDVPAGVVVVGNPARVVRRVRPESPVAPATDGAVPHAPAATRGSSGSDGSAATGGTAASDGAAPAATPEW